MNSLLLVMERILMDALSAVRRNLVEMENLQNTPRIDALSIRTFHSIARVIQKHLQEAYPQEQSIVFPKSLAPSIEMETPYSTKKSARVWHIFPVEGMLNFNHALPLFCTAICLIENNIPEACAITTPSIPDVFLAQKNKGAFRGRSRLRLTQGDTLRNMPVGVGPGITFRRGMQSPSWRMSGSTLFDLSMVASGVLKGAAWMYSPLEQSLPAGYLLVKEAGGVITYCLPPNTGMLAATQSRSVLLQACLKPPFVGKTVIKTPS